MRGGVPLRAGGGGLLLLSPLLLEKSVVPPLLLAFQSKLLLILFFLVLLADEGALSKKVFGLLCVSLSKRCSVCFCVCFCDDPQKIVAVLYIAHVFLFSQKSQYIRKPLHPS